MRLQSLSHRSHPIPVLIGVALVALTLSPASAAARGRSVRETARSAAERFLREQPGTRVTIDAKTGLVRSLANLAPTGQPGGDGVAAAEKFLATHREMLLGDRAPEEMSLAAVDRVGTGTHVTYQQQYRGLPVWGARFSVHLDARGEVRLAQGTVQPGIDLETTAALPAAEAIRRAKESVGNPALRAAPRATLGVTGDSGPARLAYRVELAALPPADWRIFVDAESGAVLGQMDLLRRADAEGLVFDENPFTTPDLALRPLTGLLGGGILKGAYADVGSFDRIDAVGRIFGKRLSRAQDQRFVATPEDPGFDEQMIYYHVTRMHDFLRSTFGYTDRDHALPVVAHMPDVTEFTHRVVGPLDNAYYSPLLDAIFFGDGTGAENGGINATSRDADVIYHEYAHAALQIIVPNLTGETRYNVFGGALDEGYSDYLACALNNDAEVAEHSAGHPEGMRNLANERRFPEDVNHPKLGEPESHWTGTIWAGACWELRGKLGADVTDRIVFRSLYYLPRDGKATLQSAAEALLEADAAEYNGTHAPAIRQVMSGRGLLGVAVAVPGDRE
jgi:Zn-dependent metalloprotease